MRSAITSGLLLIAAALCVSAQTSTQPDNVNPPASETTASSSNAQQNGYRRPDAGTRQKRYINSMVGPFALGRTVATAGISTWRNSPEEWGTKWEGFGRRVASNFG